VEECGPCPVFAGFNLAFALQLRRKHGKTSVRVRKASVSVQFTYYQNTHTLQNPYKHTHYKTHTHTHTHTLHNNIKPTQYKLKQTQCRIFINSFSSLSYDRSKVSSKASCPHSAIQSFLLQMKSVQSFP